MRVAGVVPLKLLCSYPLLAKPFPHSQQISIKEERREKEPLDVLAPKGFRQEVKRVNEGSRSDPSLAPLLLSTLSETLPHSQQVSIKEERREKENKEVYQRYIREVFFVSFIKRYTISEIKIQPEAYQ